MFTKFIFHQKNTPNRVFGGLLNPYLLGGVFFAPIVLILKIGESFQQDREIIIFTLPKKNKIQKIPNSLVEKNDKKFPQK